MPPEHNRPTHAWVIFSGEASLPILRFLKKGFRHCAVILNDGRNWISIDPLMGHIHVMTLDVSPEFDLPSLLNKTGFLTVPAGTVATPQRIAPPMICTCVEVVKRIIGLHRARIITPYHLYRHLKTTKGT